MPPGANDTLKRLLNLGLQMYLVLKLDVSLTVHTDSY
jgi:hypothetical protein